MTMDQNKQNKQSEPVDFKAYRIGMKLNGVWDQLAKTEAFRRLMLSQEFLRVLGSPYVSMHHLALLTNAKTTEHNVHIIKLLTSQEFQQFVQSQALRQFLQDCDVLKALKSFKVFKVKENPKVQQSVSSASSDASEDSSVHIDSFKKHKKILFSFMIYNLFRDSNISNSILQSHVFRKLYQSDEADALARTQVSQILSDTVYQGKTDNLVELTLALVGTQEFAELLESEEMWDFLNSSSVATVIKNYMTSKTAVVTATDASLSQDSSSEESESSDVSESDESSDESSDVSIPAPPACDASDNLHLSTTVMSESESDESEESESESDESDESSDSDESESSESSESSVLMGSWVSTSLKCKTETQSQSESQTDSSTSEVLMVCKGKGSIVLKASSPVSIKDLVKQLANPQVANIIDQPTLSNILGQLSQIKPNTPVADAIEADPALIQKMNVIHKSIKSKDPQQIRTAVYNNYQQLMQAIQQAKAQASKQQPAPVNGKPAPVNGKPIPVVTPSVPIPTPAPVKPQINLAQIQALYKSSFIHVIYRYFKENADMKAYSRFIGKTVTCDQFKQWKKSEDSLAEFQQFVIWYCANKAKVVSAIRRSLELLLDNSRECDSEDDEEDFTTNDLYVGFKKYITFADWIHFQRFIRWAGKGGCQADDCDGFRGWCSHYAQDEEYSRGDFEDWKETFSYRDFVDVVNFMRWKGSKKLYNQAC